MIYLIITSTINNKFGLKDATIRKNIYLKCITRALEILPNNIKPIIVENSGLTSSYLDTFNCDVCYTDNNKYNFIHKGVNELLDIKEVIKKYNIQDDDVIIKLTGRYFLENDTFLQLVKNQEQGQGQGQGQEQGQGQKQSQYDAYIKFFNICTLAFMDNDCILGLIAVKCKYLKQFKYELCFKTSAEVQFATFIKQNIKKLYVVKNLFLTCTFADNSKVITV